MRLNNWFIRNLDDIQREVVIESIDKSIIVQGMAGSGKTNLAIHRANQAKNKGSYAIVIMTIALKRMIAYGMKSLGLDSERIAYEWSWENRGFDMDGDLYCVGHKEKSIIDSEEEVTIKEVTIVDDNSILYLVNGNKIRKFELVFKEYQPSYEMCKEHFGLDFADWVDDAFYRAWKRRTSWFKEVSIDSEFSVEETDKYQLVPAGTLYKPIESKIDYLVVDEAQDFNEYEYKTKFIPNVNKSISLFGDSNQKMISKGNSLQILREAFPNYKNFNLKYKYRLPKTIARVAQKIAQTKIDLLSDNIKAGGNSDFPYFPKPIIKKCDSKEDEIKWIANLIINEDLDDVAILVQDKNQVNEVINLLKLNNINEVQTFYRTGNTVPFHTINTLDFSNNDLPCILDYYSAKGSEFDNVFIPFASRSKVGKWNDFFVACTRSSRSLYISYSGIKTSFLDKVDKSDIVEYK